MTMQDATSLGSDIDLEPFELTVLSKKFENISRDMTKLIVKTARSGVISVARDFSSAITLHDGRQFMLAEGLPVHSANLDLIIESTLELFDDIQEGDAFFTNTPFYGNTHHADYTIYVPVFYGGEFLFWTVTRCHQADIGAPEASFLLPEAETIYQEGTHFPPIRIQDDFEDIDDVIRVFRLNLRHGEGNWLGDYAASVGAARLGEERIKELCDEYGVEKVKKFTEEWIDYGERMIVNEIEQLPKKEVEYTTYHDPVHGVPDGVPVHVKLSVDPDEAIIELDLRENIDNMPNGYNMCEATTVAGCYAGVFHNLSDEVPINEGSIRRIRPILGEGKAIGKAKYPVGTSGATSNVADVFFHAVAASFAKLGEPYGLGEGPSGIPVPMAVISGTDPRKDDREFIDMIFQIASGGGALHGTDGWMTLGNGTSAGVLARDSIEVEELKLPILVERNEVLKDSEGAGRWRGGMSGISIYGPREDCKDPFQVAYYLSDREYPPKGVRGGGATMPADAIKITDDGSEEQLPGGGIVEIHPTEKMKGIHSGGGGYGDPMERDPELVRMDVDERDIISVERARETYGVALVETEGGYEVDADATSALRENGTRNQE